MQMQTQSQRTSTSTNQKPTAAQRLAGLILSAGVVAATASMIFSTLPLRAQNEVAPSAAGAASIPKLIRFSGTLTDGRGWPITTPVSVTFAIYAQPSGDDQPALWQETQQIAPNSKGGYTALLGSANPAGIPIEIFKSGESQYLSVKVEGEAEQPRTLLVSVPYALKAADAATLGGLPASAYALAGSRTAAGAAAIRPDITPDAAANVTTTGGTTGYVPVFNGASTVIDSPVFVKGADIGIGTVTPGATLDVAGTALVEGGLTVDTSATLNAPLMLTPVGTATAAKAYPSQYMKIATSAWNSSSSSAVQPRFEWQAQVQGNDTASPTATLTLSSSTTTSPPTQTGFYFNANGTINFAPGQTFPGGGGTITGVTAGTALTGGGTSGTVTLNVDTTKVPLLKSANTFTGNQIITGNLTDSGTVTAGTVNATSGFDLGGSPFAFGSPTKGNAFLGFAGNASTTGADNTAIGSGALTSNTTGADNTASGVNALATNTTGSSNAASGFFALLYDTTGSRNTGIGDYAGTTADTSSITGSYNSAVGYSAAFGTGSITNATAIGALAEADQSNTLILGCVKGKNGCTTSVNVGIGTTTPTSALQVNGAIAATSASFSGPVTFAPGQTFPGAGGAGTITGVTAGSALTGGGTTGNVTLNLDTSKVPLLTSANSFTGNQTITGNATVSGSLTATGGIKTPLGVGIAAPAYDLEVYNPTATAAQLAMVSNGTDAAISLNNTNTANGGREYWLDSGSGKAAVGTGNFAIWDATAGATRLVIDSTGQVGIGETNSIFSGSGNDQFIVESTVPISGPVGDAITGLGAYGSVDRVGSTGVLGNGASTDYSSGSLGGVGGGFYGGNADTAADAGYGIYAKGGEAAGPATYQYAAFFDGNIYVSGGVDSVDSIRQIDHPTDPANKYLNHASVQSSEMMNIYSGNVTTDELGLATVKLPDWFETENGAFRYQLTVLDERFAQAVVSRKIQNGQFTIHTNASKVEVSWQITAVRQDAYAKAHPLVVEEAKPAREVGFYRHPELYGQPEEKQTEWGRNPKMMQRMEAQRTAIKARQANGGKPQTAPAVAVTQLKSISQVESK